MPFIAVRFFPLAAVAAVLAIVVGARSSAAASAVAAETPHVDFARDVLPILSDNCYHCHGPDEKARKAKLRFDTKEGAFRLDKDGAAVIIPGDAARSELVRRITSNDPEERMPPPEGIRKLTPAQVETLKRWVQQGAAWGTHWAFVPPQRYAPPPVKQQAWVRNEIDNFVLAPLEKEGIAPQPEADKERLIRRVTFDLTGLPPTPAETKAFVDDKSPDAYEHVVDRLLASSRYGERMAGDWMDVARFADTHGYQADRYRPMWAYRDWVIKAYNENLPFDKFLTWQLAGDLLPNATKEQRLATAFNRLHCQNEEGGIVEEEFRVAYVVDRVDTMGTAFMAMTFECCRCHDHKYDPISQKDFYSLFSFFQNIDESGQTSYFTDPMPVPTMLLSSDQQDAKLAELEKHIAEKKTLLESATQRALGQPFADWLKSHSTEAPAKLSGCLADYVLEARSAKNQIDPKKPGNVNDSLKSVDVDGRHVAQLSGENGYSFPGAGQFSRSDPFSFSLHICPTILEPRAVVLHKSKAPIDAGSRGYELLLEDGHVAFGLHHMWPGNSMKVVTKAAIAKDKWATLTVTYDGSSKADGVRIFIDGEPAELTVVRDDLEKDIRYGGGEPELVIGNRFRDNGFKGGQIDSLQIYDRAISHLEAEWLAGKDGAKAALRQNDGSASKEDLALLNEYYLSTISPEVAQARADLRTARKAQAEAIEGIPEAMVMKEMPHPKPAYILKRGSYDQHGEEVTANAPHAFPPMAADLPKNRLGLANWMTAPTHPLTGRVAVNRLWQQMFGRGIVETTENFGRTGAMPSHPELLDELSRVFVDNLHWDQKKLLKMIAMSATYRQSSKAPADLLARDPHNELLARGPARRLSAEMLRDQALADSGLLVEKIGGPSVKPYQPPGLWEIASGGGYDQGHGQDLYRRSLYTYVKRTVAPPSLLTFDAGDRSVCAVRRQSTSTPLQALAMLNDMQLTEAARKVAERALLEGGATDDSRTKFMFGLITGRAPSDREAAVLLDLLREQREVFAKDAEAAKKLLAVGESKNDPELSASELAAYTVLAEALFNHDEAMMRR